MFFVVEPVSGDQASNEICADDIRIAALIAKLAEVQKVFVVVM